jgi:predicted transcriptional regulator
VKKMRRSKIEIVRDILQCCRYSAKRRTWIGQRVHVAYSKNSEIVEVCLKKGLLEAVPIKHPLGKAYLTTNLGVEYINNVDKAMKLLEKPILSTVGGI